MAHHRKTTSAKNSRHHQKSSSQQPGVMTKDYGGEDYSMYLDDDDVMPMEKQRKNSPSHLKKKLLRLLKIKKPRKSSADGYTNSLGPSIHEMSFADTKIGCQERGYQMYRDEKGQYCTAPRGFIQEINEPTLSRKPSTRASYLNSEVLFRRQKTLKHNGMSAALQDLALQECDKEGSVTDSSAPESSISESESADVHAPIQCPKIVRSMSTSNVTDQKTWITTFLSEPNLTSQSILSCVLCEPRHKADFEDFPRTKSWIAAPEYSSTDIFVEMETCVTSL